MEKKTVLKAEVGDSVLVLNYRKRPAEWELATVEIVSTHWGSKMRDSVNKDYQRNSYDVVLERRGKPNISGNLRVIWLTVGDESIKQAMW